MAQSVITDYFLISQPATKARHFSETVFQKLQEGYEFTGPLVISDGMLWREMVRYKDALVDE